jgi:uncharacterized GH25 family protein
MAGAHSLWLNIDDDRPKAGQKVRIEIGWGHKFPRDEVIKEGFLNDIYALDLKGTRIPVKQISKTEIEFIPPAQGIYTIAANIRPGFLSKTAEGYSPHSKIYLKNAISCFYYDIRTKAFIYAEYTGRKLPHRVIGDPLEIVPLKHGIRCKQGEALPVKVVYNGKALAHADVYATYDGFSDKPYTWAIKTKTDKNGIARIDLLKTGNWLVNVVYEVPYSDQEECDNYRYNSSFTFIVH